MSVVYFLTRQKRSLAASLIVFSTQHVTLRLAWVLTHYKQVCVCVCVLYRLTLKPVKIKPRAGLPGCGGQRVKPKPIITANRERPYYVINTFLTCLFLLLIFLLLPGSSSSSWRQLLLWNNRHLAAVQTHERWVWHFSLREAQCEFLIRTVRQYITFHSRQIIQQDFKPYTECSLCFQSYCITELLKCFS